LHRLAKIFHILLEDFNDLEERVIFLIKAAETFTKAVALHGRSIGTTSEIYMLEYLLSFCKHSKRWISNYKDRTNIRINLVNGTPDTRCIKLYANVRKAFHLSSQEDNKLNVQISNATTAIARDAQRDSSSMITIAAVTMFFLPGTFICVSNPQLFSIFYLEGITNCSISTRIS
jgi:hypothetical protein